MARDREKPQQVKPRRPLPGLGPELGLGLFTLLLYAASFGNGLTNWDDPAYVVDNAIAQAGLKGLGLAFTRPFDFAYFPVTQVSYVLLRALLGTSGPGYHVVQALLFAGTVALVPRALAAFRIPRAPALAAAVLWAAHPLRVESVVWAANLKDTLGLLFVVAAFAVASDRKRRGAAAVLFAVGILAKSTFFPLALLFGAVELLRGEKPRTALARSLPFLLPAAAVAVVAAVLHRGIVLPPPVAHGLSLPATAAFTPFWYLWRIVLPLSPEAVYDFAWVTPGEARFLVALGLWTLVAVALWRMPARFRRGAMLGVAAYGVSLAAVSGLVSLAYPVQDRYSVIPALVVLTTLAFWLSRRSTATLVAGTALLLVGYVPLNVLRQREWESGVTLWEENVRATPRLWTPRVNLANAYATESRWTDAIRELEAAMALRPEKRDALGELFYFHGALEQIPLQNLKTLRGRLALAEYSDASLVETARYCVVREHFGSARPLLERVRTLESDPEALRLLSAVERHDRHFDSAAARAAQSVALGDELARVELVYALTDAGHPEDALRAGATRLATPLQDAQLRSARAYTLMRLGRTAEGQAEARAAMDELNGSH